MLLPRDEGPQLASLRPLDGETGYFSSLNSPCCYLLRTIATLSALVTTIVGATGNCAD